MLINFHQLCYKQCLDWHCILSLFTVKYSRFFFLSKVQKAHFNFSNIFCFSYAFWISISFQNRNDPNSKPYFTVARQPWSDKHTPVCVERENNPSCRQCIELDILNNIQYKHWHLSHPVKRVARFQTSESVPTPLVCSVLNKYSVKRSTGGNNQPIRAL